MPRTESDLPSISIIIVNRNGLRYLGPCLRSVQNLEYPHELVEVIVVDNASADGSVEYIGSNFPEVRVIQLPVNCGFCRPNNVAAQTARGQYLVLLNNDTEVEIGWLRELVRGLSVDPRIKSVTSKILYYDRRDLVNAAGGKLTTIGHGYYVGYGEPDGPAYNKPRFTGFGCGAGVLVERSFFQNMGGFDESYYAGIEEHDLGWRIWTSGYKVYYMPTARMHHWESATFGRRASYNPMKVFFATRNRLFNMTKNVQNFGKGLFLCLVHDSIMVCNFLLQRRILAVRFIFLSYFEYLRSLRRVVGQRKAIQQQRRLNESVLVAQGILAPFRDLIREYVRFFKISREPHYAEWESAEL